MTDKGQTQPGEVRSGGYRNLQAIALTQYPYGWYASLQWDNNFCNPDFATCRGDEDQALADMRAAIKADGRLKDYDMANLPVIRKSMKPEIKEHEGCLPCQ